MRYFIFVSHGQLASGMSSALSMLVGKRDNVLHVAFQDDMDAATFRGNVEALLRPITDQDEVIVMADLISGSPLTTTMELLAQHMDLAHVRAIGGMNLPLAITAIETEDDSLDDAVSSMVECAVEQVQKFALNADDSDSDDI